MKRYQERYAPPTPPQISPAQGEQEGKDRVLWSAHCVPGPGWSPTDSIPTVHCSPAEKVLLISFPEEQMGSRDALLHLCPLVLISVLSAPLVQHPSCSQSPA